MPDVREVFDMVTQKAGPEPGALQRQGKKQRRRARNQKVVAIGLVAVIVVAGAVVFASSRSTGGATTASQPDSGFGSVYESDGEIFVRGVDGSSVALTTGFLPVWSPDRTMIAFLRDPRGARHRTADPFILQLWLIRPDGSGLRKLAVERGCCVGASANLYWRPDSASIVFSGIHSHVVNVATGSSRPL
jgi:Tol biopolymer transport system component